VSIVLDAGGLVAIERDDRELWSALKRAALATESVVVPSTALAQVWRGGPRQARLARVLQHCVVADFDALAREVGVLCGVANTRDICDAHVALVASRQATTLYTSDPDDMRKLLKAVGPSARRPTLVKC
jgi:hypothetical protein